jgi:23S rRNA-intervening sequence protein
MQYMGTFRDLAVYRRSAGFGDALYRCTASWDSFARWTVGVQLVRSADSIGANIAESRGRRSDLDQRRFLIVARGSALELEPGSSAPSNEDCCSPRPPISKSKRSAGC